MFRAEAPLPLAASTARSPASSSRSTIVADSVPRLSSRSGEHLLERGAQVERAPEGLADLEQVGELARVGGAGGHEAIMTEMSTRGGLDRQTCR